MSEPIRADYQQLLLLPASVEEWVGPRHLARFVREFVEALDLAALGFEVGGAATGRPRYSDELLLKIWVYGYLERVRSSRKLEAACGERMGLIWLCGREQPDHNTLWRFGQTHRATLKRLYRQVVQVAAGADLVGVALHAVDGTTIAARASRRGMKRRAQLAAVLAQLDAAVEEVLAQVEAAEAAEDGGGAVLPAEWEQTVRLRERVRELVGRMEASEQAAGTLAEPEARPMRTTGGTVPSYNAQLVVDAASGVIVGQTVVTEPDDTYQLAGMLEEVGQTLGRTAEYTLADAGYHAPAALAAVAARGHQVLVHESPRRAPAAGAPGTEYHAARFTYDGARNVCICPRGVELAYAGSKAARGHRAEARVYRCTAYGSCPVRWQCSRAPRGRQIEIGLHHAAVVAQRAARAEPQNRARLRRRGAIVEGVIGIAKSAMEFRRFTVGGLENVRAQWSWICTAVNLRKLYVRWAAGTFAWAS
jgi:transposase